MLFGSRSGLPPAPAPGPPAPGTVEPVTPPAPAPVVDAPGVDVPAPGVALRSSIGAVGCDGWVEHAEMNSAAMAMTAALRMDNLPSKKMTTPDVGRACCCTT